MALTKVPSNLDATVSVTQSASDNSTNIATTAYVTTAIANLVDGAPSTLNTLDEIAAALNDDAALNTTLTNSIATKLPLAGGTMTGGLGIGAAVSTGYQLQLTGQSGYDDILRLTAVGTNIGARINLTNTGTGVARLNATNNSLALQTGGTSALTLDSSQNATFAGNIIGNDVKAAGSGGLSLHTDEGTKRLFIKDNGDVKVGNLAVGSATTAPLHVAKASADVQAIFGDNNSSIDDPSIRIIGRDSGNSAIRYMFAGLDADANHGYIGYNAGAGGFVNALNFDTSGNVGIGNTNPAATLEVGTLTSGSTGNVIINSEGGNPPALQVKSRTNRARINIQDNDTSGYIIAEGSVISIGFADQLSDNNININSSHNVGIGTSTPDSRLHVYHGAKDNTTLTLENYLATANGAQYLNWQELLFAAGGSGPYAGIRQYANGWQNSDAALAFWTQQHGGSYAERMRINGDGNVGIGRTDPDYALDVSGSSNDGNPLLRGTATNTPSGGFNWATEFISPNLANDKRLTHIFGKQRTTHRMAHISYLPKSTASQSYLALGLWGANDILNVLGNGNVGINTVTPLTKFQVVHTAWSSGAPYGSLVHIDGGSNHDNNWGHLHVNQSGTGANTGGRIRLGTSANNGYGGNPIAGITALNKDSSNGTYGNLEFSTRPSGGTNQMRMELSHNGHIKLSGDHGIRVFTGYFNAGTVSTNFDVSGYGAGVMMMTAAFNHYGFIQGYGCYKRAICSNGPGHGGTSIEVNDVDSAISTGNGGSWTFHRQSGTQTSYRITKNAGTYAGGGYYWVRFEGNMGV